LKCEVGMLSRSRTRSSASDSMYVDIVSFCKYESSATLQIWTRTKQTGLAYGQVHLYIIIIACRYDICELRDGGAPACDEAEIPRSSVSWCKRRHYSLV
jgi:hypothetical protein